MKGLLKTTCSGLRKTTRDGETFWGWPQWGAVTPSPPSRPAGARRRRVTKPRREYWGL